MRKHFSCFVLSAHLGSRRIVTKVSFSKIQLEISGSQTLQGASLERALD